MLGQSLSAGLSQSLRPCIFVNVAIGRPCISVSVRNSIQQHIAQNRKKIYSFSILEGSSESRMTHPLNGRPQDLRQILAEDSHRSSLILLNALECILWPEKH